MVRTFRKVITHINITHFIANKINADKWIFEFTKSAFDCLFKWFTNRHFILTVVYLTCNLSSSGFQMLFSSTFCFEHESTITNLKFICSSFSSKFHIGHIEFSVNQFASRFRWHDVVGCEWMESERLVGILLLSKSNEILTEWTINLPEFSVIEYCHGEIWQSRIFNNVRDFRRHVMYTHS